MKIQWKTFFAVAISVLLFVYIFQRAFIKMDTTHLIIQRPKSYTSIEGATNMSTDWPLDVKFTLDEERELGNLSNYVEPPTTTPNKDDALFSQLEKDSVENASKEQKKLDDLPLREFVIKSSYNSAYDGSRFSTEQLGKVMANGCRFVDLQLFSASGGTIYVAHSDIPRSDTTDTSLPFSEVLGYLSLYAFNYDNKIRPGLMDQLFDREAKEERETGIKKQFNENKPNIRNNYTQYPLFVHLRINRPPNSEIDIIETIYTKYLNPESKTPIVPPKFLYMTQNNSYALPVSGSTKLSDLRGKIIFVMEIDNILQNYTTSFNADDVPLNTRKYLKKFVNVLTGGHTWKANYNYDDISSSEKILLYAKDNGLDTNVVNMYIAYPSIKNSSNPPTPDFILNHRIQTIPQRFYNEDKYLEEYNKMFDTLRKPMLPLAYVVPYLKPNK